MDLNTIQTSKFSSLIYATAKLHVCIKIHAVEVISTLQFWRLILIFAMQTIQECMEVRDHKSLQ